MFIINITYTEKLEKIDTLLTKHIDFLNQQYETGNFILSGKKTPRTGGIIVSRVSNRKELEEIIEKDPFFSNNVANYELIEFIPSKASKELEFLL